MKTSQVGTFSDSFCDADPLTRFECFSFDSEVTFSDIVVVDVDDAGIESFSENHLNPFKVFLSWSKPLLSNSSVL